MCSQVVLDCDKDGPWIAIGKDYVMGARKSVKHLNELYNQDVDIAISSNQHKLLTVLAEFHLYW